MPNNYNFEENWYDIIVPLLNTGVVKNSIKKGILRYMNDTLDKDVKFKSYQNIFDYFNKKHGKYYLNKNSSPSDYSSCITEHQIEWEGDLIEKGIEANVIIQSGSWFSYKNEKVAQGRENFRMKLKENKDLKINLEKDVKGYLGL